MAPYSPVEVSLFTELGLCACLDKDPQIAYREAIESAFLSGFTGPLIDTLREAARAFLLEGMSRPSAQFDALIQPTSTPEPEGPQDVLTMFG